MADRRFSTRSRALIAAGALAAVLALLALDLANQGAAWSLLWHLTGEETPLAQLRGAVEWAGKFTRTPPDTRPLVPIQHVDAIPYGVNTFLQLEVEPEKRARSAQMIAEAGFGWIRQQFPWEDIEIHGRGDFEDRRNDLTGDGQPDAISAWDKYDMIVDLAEQHGLKIMARLDNPPAWSHASPDSGPFAPPDDVQDFVNYARAVAERYRGRIRHYQVWNEPNIFPEWGNQPVNPEAYTELLCRTYAALKAVDPQIVVISAPLSPTVSLTPENLSDLVFLARMYEAGAGDCFDVMSTQGYGFFSGPTDRRMRVTDLTFARHIYIRDMMVRHGDAHKPIWISEAAWNPVDAPDVPPDVSGRANYGVVTPEQAARYMPLAYQRAQEEWPWVGVMFYWFFKRPADYERDQSWYYFRLVEPDFTPLPVYHSLRAHITGQTPVLHPGVHQAESWRLTRPADAEIVSAAGAQFGEAVQTAWIGFHVPAHYDLLVRWQGEGDGPTTTALADGWQQTHIQAKALFPQGAVETALGEPGGPPLLIDSITVFDRTFERLYPPLAGAAALLALLLWVIVSAARARRRAAYNEQDAHAHRS